jgi:hypothetical protein
MPVFFITDTQGETTRINAMGLALMFRLPYNATPDQLADKQQQPRARQEKFLDLAECIFGRSVESNSLRGRVHIETFEGMKGACQERSEPVTTVLNSPKPTFYPNYLEQPIARDQDGRHDPSGHLAAGASYSTWMDDGENGRPAARIRGWKRYATSPDTAPISWPYPPMRNNRPNLDVATRFRPLNAGAKFRGRIHIHNLRRVELGALLWAITWGGNDALRHRLGMAKPLGFGTVVLRLTGQADLCATDAAQISVPLDASTVGLLRDEFTQAMQQWCTSPSIRLPDWEQTPQIRALVALANPEYRWPMKLTHPERVKDFANYKSAAQALLPPETKELPPPHQSPLPPKPAPEPPVVLPNLAGQERRVSFLRTTRLPKRASDSLIFRLKEGSDKFEARLDDPQRPDLCCQLHSGASFELFIVGAEEGVYLLSETKPD